MVNERTNENSFPKAENTSFALGFPTCLNSTLPSFFLLIDWHSESSLTSIYCNHRNESNYKFTCLRAHSSNHSRKLIFTIKPFQIQNTKYMIHMQHPDNERGKWLKRNCKKKQKRNRTSFFSHFILFKKSTQTAPKHSFLSQYQNEYFSNTTASERLKVFSCFRLKNDFHIWVHPYCLTREKSIFWVNIWFPVWQQVKMNQGTSPQESW